MWFIIALVVFAVWFFVRYIWSDYTPPSFPNAPVPPVQSFSGRDLPIVSPATGQVLETVKSASEEEVKDVVKRARIAQQKWKDTSFAERRSVLMDVMQYVIDHAAEITEISIKESGKVRLEAVSGELLPTCEKIRYICSQGEYALREESRSVPALLFLKKACVRYFPLGVIGCIVPGNFPFHNAVSHITTAIFSGNAAVVKVSEWGTLSRRFIQNMYNTILSKRGHSPDLVSVLPGYGDTGAALINGGVDKILFIGSPSTGQRVMKACADAFVPVTLELGGKDPLIVFDDADFEHAATICLRAVFWNCGQNCISAERIYVQSGIYDKFIAWMTPRVKALRQGDAMQGDFDIGAFGIPQQASIVDNLVQEAVSKGAKVLAGGKKNAAFESGRFYEPTLLVNVSHDMEVVKKECFGPVMTVLRFESTEELLKGVNSSDFALGASVFTTDYSKADRVSRAIGSGMVSINEWGMSALVSSLPFGGKALSGFGRFAGPEGLRDFCHVQAVVTDRLPLRTPQPSFLSYPLPSYAPDIMSGAIGLIYSHGAKAKITHLLGLLSLAKNIFLNGGKHLDSPQRSDLNRYFENPEDTLAERQSLLLSKHDDRPDKLALLAAMKRRSTRKGLDEEATLTPENKLKHYLESGPMPNASRAVKAAAEEAEGSTVSSDDDDDEGSKSYTAKKSDPSTPETMAQTAVTRVPPSPREESSEQSSKGRLLHHDDSSSHVGDTTETTGLNRRNREGIKSFYEGGAVLLNPHQSFSAADTESSVVGGGGGEKKHKERRTSSDNESDGSSASYDDASESASSLRGSVKLPTVASKAKSNSKPDKAESQQLLAADRQILLEEIAEIDLDIMRAKKNLPIDVELLILKIELESKERILNCVRQATRK